MTALVKISVSIIPVFIFLSALVFLDSYKLVRIRGIVQTIVAGCVVGVVCFFITSWVFRQFDWELGFYSRYISPLLEESLKACYILYLIRKKKIGFMVDGAIYGFAVGAGFAVVENIDYLISLQESNLFLWVIRGFGTAVMHGGTTSIFAILTKSVSQQQPSERVYHYVPGFLVAMAIHSFFNQFLFDPRLTTVVQLIVLPVLIAIIFTRSEKALRDWLELGLDTDVLILEHIVEGRISETKIGSYLDSLKSQFTGEVVADMLCYLRIYLELAIRAKGMLMMRGAGYACSVDLETKERFTELRYLEKSIGKTGKLAISPLLHGNTRDLWQLFLIDEK